jgi:hypothetical protein
MTTKFPPSYQNIEFDEICQAERNKKEKDIDRDWKDIVFFDINLIERWKEYRQKKALYALWVERNFNHCDVFIDTLEIETIVFHQTIFVENSPELMIKLSNLGFQRVVGFPDEGHNEAFSNIAFWKKHNIALSLYDKVNEAHLNCAIAIAKQSSKDEQMQKNIFNNTMKVLLTGK